MRLAKSFYTRDVLVVAPDLLGKVIHVGRKTGVIAETEAYEGKEDMASHARFGITKRNGVMFDQGGLVYMYLVYGMHWMLNIVTGTKGNAQAVLVRGLVGINGPGKVTKFLGLDKSFYGEDLTNSNRIWIQDSRNKIQDSRIIQTSRIGVEYSGNWAKKPWRWVLVCGAEVIKPDQGYD